jgi:membrane-associated phospholipid phosphatase
MAVGLSRMYRGMHYPTDVLFGALLGGASVIATVIVLRGARERQHEIVPRSVPADPEPTLVGVGEQ